jgi:hypothetical protein
MWRNVPDNNVPRVFDSLCHETVSSSHPHPPTSGAPRPGLPCFVLFCFPFSFNPVVPPHSLTQSRPPAQRFAFFTTIPSFVLQLALLALAFRAISSRTSSSTRGMRLDEEKNHELVQVHQQPFPAKS